MENLSTVSPSGKKALRWSSEPELWLAMFALTQITKEAVDSFSPGQVFPSCQLIAEWTKESKPMRLTHKVTLVGAKEPSNYFTIVLDTGPTPPGIPRGGLMCMIMCTGVLYFVAGLRKLVGRSNRN